MKRSVLNRYISEAAEFFESNHFALPPFASWTPDQWNQSGSESSELKRQRLGWDVTDFNTGNFVSVGLTMFTLRNGLAGSVGNNKPYAEKIMMVRDHQVTPYHYHEHKIEDIINRGGKGSGHLVVQLHKSTSDRAFSDDAFTVYCDGVAHHLKPGAEVELGPGESITLPPRLYHTFHAIGGDALIGEVSSINDDDTDNFFHEPIGRYPDIEEDEPTFRLLCTEYK